MFLIGGFTTLTAHNPRAFWIINKNVNECKDTSNIAYTKSCYHIIPNHIVYTYIVGSSPLYISYSYQEQTYQLSLYKPIDVFSTHCSNIYLFLLLEIWRTSIEFQRDVRTIICLATHTVNWIWQSHYCIHVLCYGHRWNCIFYKLI